MKSSLLYKNCLIVGESFQREKNGKWVPQYRFTRQGTGGETKGFPAYQYQFERAFGSEEEADDFALRSAKEWLDQHG